MARIRSIHPDLFTDPAYISLSILARLFILGIWTESDDHGAFDWQPVRLRLRILPADDVSGDDLLEELVTANVVRKVEIDGRSYGLVRNFCRFQRPKKPTFKVEIPVEHRNFVALKDDGSLPGHHHITGITQEVGKPRGRPVERMGEINAQEKEEGGRRKGKEESNHIDKPVVVVVTREPEKPASTTTTTKAIDQVSGKANPLGTALPEDWTPNDHDQRVAASFGMAGAAVEEQLLEFHAYNASKGTFSPDWSATWFRWCSAWKIKQPKEAPRVQVSAGYVPSEADWTNAAKTWAKSQRWSRHLGNEPGMGGCKCPPAILTEHGIDPATGMVKPVAS